MVQVLIASERMYAVFHSEVNMGIATEVLALRHHHFSSVHALLAALERIRDCPLEKHSIRQFAAMELADTVLTNVAAHAAEAMEEPMPTRRSRKVASPYRRKHRQSHPGSISNRIQGRLFTA